MKDCRARKVKRRVAFRGHLLLGDDERMSNGIFTAPRCRGNAAHAPSQRAAGRARLGSWRSGSWRHCRPSRRRHLRSCQVVPYKVDSGSVAVQCGKLIDGVAAAAHGLSTVVIRNGRVEAVQPGAATPPGLPVVDLRQYTCLPGSDRHAHAPDGQRPRDVRSQRVLQAHDGGAGRDRAGKRAHDACWPDSRARGTWARTSPGSIATCATRSTRAMPWVRGCRLRAFT